MKFLVVLLSVASVSLATPLAKPIEDDYLVPQAAPLVIPAPVTVARVVPLSPSPVRVLAHPAPLPLPIARTFAVPTPLTPAPLGTPIVRAAAPAPAPLPVPTPLAVAPAPVVPVPSSSSASSQFHAQDELGGFSFGYANGLSSKQEVRTPDGVTKGGYSYVDANGITQVVEYISDPVNGFRVAGTNIPVAEEAQVVTVAAPVMDTAEVAAAKAEFAAAFEAEVARNAAALEAEEAAAVVARKKRSPIENDYLVPAAPPVTVVVPQESVTIPAAPFVEPPTLVQRAFFSPAAPVAHFPRLIATPAAAPILAQPAPILAQPTPAALPIPTPLAAPISALPSPVPIVAPNTQFQAQDEFGGYSFGYQNGLSGRQESRSADGVTRGSYSYVDANGVVQQVQYTADAVNGFQVIGTNLPVAPAA